MTPTTLSPKALTCDFLISAGLHPYHAAVTADRLHALQNKLIDKDPRAAISAERLSASLAKYEVNLMTWTDPWIQLAVVRSDGEPHFI